MEKHFSKIPFFALIFLFALFLLFVYAFADSLKHRANETTPLAEIEKSISVNSEQPVELDNTLLGAIYIAYEPILLSPVFNFLMMLGMGSWFLLYLYVFIKQRKNKEQT